MISSPFRCLPWLFALAAVAPSLHAKDSVTRSEDGYELTVINDDPTLDPGFKDQIFQVFFKSYPAMAREFNPAAARKVTLSVESAMRGAAATAGTTIHFAATYIHQHPKDVDVVTHEGMHIVQSYGKYDPVWLVEGIADYARFRYGVENAEGGWSLPDFRPDQKYTDSYRVTARFLAWLETHVKPNLVKALDVAMRAGSYSPEVWKKETGKTLDELWQDYAAHPEL